jgi:hypothetical protein
MKLQTKHSHVLLVVFGSFALFVSLFLQVPTASAVPSYARQTGFPCKSCHYMPPELTPLGRAFKLNGYTMTGKPTITSPGKGNEGALNILESFPLSVMLDTSFTSLRSPEPVSQNGSFQLPQQASLFLAGAWATHVGSFVQVTYTSQGDHFTWDNADIRYANSTHLFKKDLAYGITLNNSPTIEDLWNSTPVWGFPWVGSDWAPRPTAGAVINGRLAQDVAGIGMYAMWNNHLYLDGTIYRSAHIGAPQPNMGVDGSGAPLRFNIRGVAPYWRLAWQQNWKNNNLMIGTYGMHMKSTPGAITGLEDGYTDWAADFQYDVSVPRFRNDVISFRGTYIRENSSLLSTFTSGGADLVRHHLNTVQANAEYHFGDKYSATFGGFDVNGTPDFLLYSGATTSGGITMFPAVTSSANGDPRSSGYIANLSWWPVQNIGLSFQYTGYTRFNGARLDYDGNGRNANSNNTVYLIARFVF